jgi:hypothetical protein|tara:strand:- start:364 stop:474 length:111 start_codon:yes stop_codon:yes gene_type:complete
MKNKKEKIEKVKLYPRIDKKISKLKKLIEILESKKQ